VIDEWDKMLYDQGLSRDLEHFIKNLLPSIERYICSSATFNHAAFASLSCLFQMRWEMLRSDAVSKRSIRHFLVRAGLFDK
jgi:superfamily II DNA/RNA helicase